MRLVRATQRPKWLLVSLYMIRNEKLSILIVCSKEWGNSLPFQEQNTLYTHEKNDTIRKGIPVYLMGSSRSYPTATTFPFQWDRSHEHQCAAKINGSTILSCYRCTINEFLYYSISTRRQQSTVELNHFHYEKLTHSLFILRPLSALIELGKFSIYIR